MAGSHHLRVQREILFSAPCSPDPSVTKGNWVGFQCPGSASWPEEHWGWRGGGSSRGPPHQPHHTPTPPAPRREVQSTQCLCGDMAHAFPWLECLTTHPTCKPTLERLQSKFLVPRKLQHRASRALREEARRTGSCRQDTERQSLGGNKHMATDTGRRGHVLLWS